MKIILFGILTLLFCSCEQTNLYPKVVSVKICDNETEESRLVKNPAKINEITEALSCREREFRIFKPKYWITLNFENSDSTLIGLTSGYIKIHGVPYALCNDLEDEVSELINGQKKE